MNSVQPRLLKIKQVVSVTNIGKTKIYALIKKGKFPPQVYSEGTSFWAREQVEDWIENQIKRIEK